MRRVRAFLGWWFASMKARFVRAIDAIREVLFAVVLMFAILYSFDIMNHLCQHLFSDVQCRRNWLEHLAMLFLVSVLVWAYIYWELSNYHEETKNDETE